MKNDNIISAYVPMSETAYYILLSLTKAKHGYGIMQHVSELTSSRIRLGPGTLYGSISKMENDGLIRFVKEESKRKTYEITPLGNSVLKTEVARITELYLNAKGVMGQ